LFVDVMAAVPIWLQALISFFEAAAFAVLFKVPRQRLIWAGVAGMVSWTLYSTTIQFGLGRLTAGFLGAAVASTLSEWGARRLRLPVTLLVVPAIIPLVPGFDAYWAMLAFLHKDNLQGIDTMVEAVLLALSVAAGVVTAATLFRIQRTKSRADQADR
jgi:uncharacterized membrane protein YjjB (DUF3815 family)